MGAQTILAASFRKAKVEFGTATAAASLISIDGQACAVAVTGGERGSAEGHTFEGDFPAIAPGKVGSRNILVRFLYTEAVDEAFQLAKTIFELEGGPCFLRYSPLGGDTATDLEHKTANAAGTEAAGIMTQFEYPSGEAADNALIKGSFTVNCARILSEAVGA